MQACMYSVKTGFLGRNGSQVTFAGGLARFDLAYHEQDLDLSTGTPGLMWYYYGAK
jgi:hypothetical protein